MLGINREDDLLSKLKSCIGSLKTENSTLLPSKGTNASQHYNAIKENYRQPSITPPPSTANNGNTTKNSYYPQHPYPERQPLSASNHPAPSTYQAPVYNYPQPPRHEIPTHHNRYQQEVRPRTKVDDYRSSENTPRKFEYSFQPKRGLQREERKVTEGTGMGMGLGGGNIGADHSSRSRQDIRSEISRRYSLMQNDRAPYKQPETTQPILTPAMPTKTRTYQQEVQQRRELLQPTERRDRTPQVGVKDYSGSIRKESYTSRESGRIKPIAEITPPAPSSSIHSARKPDRPLMVAETLQRAYEQQAPNNSECTALAKLRKISELNEKINDRIRNIINVFEQHKR